MIDDIELDELDKADQEVAEDQADVDAEKADEAVAENTRVIQSMFDDDEGGEIVQDNEADPKEESVIEDKTGKPDDKSPEPEPEGDSEKKPDAEPAKAAPKFEERIVTYAKEKLGFSDEEIALFPNQDTLVKAIALSRPAPDAAAETKPAADAKIPADDKAVAAKAALKAQLDLVMPNGVELEPKIAKAFEAINEHYAGAIEQRDQKIAKLEDVVANTFQFLNERLKRDDEDEFDAQIAALGEEWQDIFGKGPTRIQNETTDAFKNRVKVAKQVRLLVDGHHKSGDLSRRIRDFVENAAHSVFPDKVKNLSRAQFEKAVVKKEKQIQHPPSQRKARAPTGIERAYERVGEILGSGADEVDELAEAFG